MSWEIQEWILKGPQQVQALGFLVVEIKDETNSNSCSGLEVFRVDRTQAELYLIFLTLILSLIQIYFNQALISNTSVQNNDIIFESVLLTGHQVWLILSSKLPLFFYFFCQPLIPELHSLVTVFYYKPLLGHLQGCFCFSLGKTHPAQTFLSSVPPARLTSQNSISPRPLVFRLPSLYAGGN